MKFYLTVLALILIGGLVYAEPDMAVFTIQNKVSTTNTTTTPSRIDVNGYIDSIHIDVTGTTTGLLTIVSGQDIIVTNTVTADKVIRPRVTADTSAGVAYTGGTNSNEKILLCNERITVRLSETAPTTNNYTIKIKYNTAD
jgi:hypothetical protein